MSQNLMVEVLIYFFTVLSLFGSWYIVNKIRKQEEVTPAQRLLCYLSIGDMSFSIGTLIYVQPGT